MQRDADVIIVGGGLNGPALALGLAQVGITSVILDAQPPQTMARADFDGRAYAIALATRRMLAALGVWDGVAAEAQPILDIKVSDGRPGAGALGPFVHFDHRELGEGPMGHLIEDRYLRTALHQTIASDARISLRAPATVIAQDVGPGHASVTLEGGETVSAALLVGCDGRASGTASRAGVARRGWDYGQTALVCAVAHSRPHHATAHQLFLPAGPLALLPLPGDRMSVVWTEAAAVAESLEDSDEATYMAALAPKIGSFLGTLSLTGHRHAYPLGLSLAERLTAPRLALVGDAAHGIHPLAGQGLNLGFRDVAALAEVLGTAKTRGEDLGADAVLARYARWRRADIAALASATDLVNRVFSNDTPWLRAARGLALGAAQALPPVRRAMMREATGLSGDLPRLMRGQSLRLG